MELDVAIVGSIVLSFVGILSYKAFAKYNSSESAKAVIQLQTDQTTLIFQSRIKDLENSNRNYIYKVKRMREKFELSYDDIDYDEENPDDEFKLSELATSIYPKLPPSLAKLIDKESFQDAIIKTVEKRPEVLTSFIDKFLNKKESSAENGSTNKLEANYL